MMMIIIIIIVIIIITNRLEILPLHTTDAALRHYWITAGKMLTNRLDQVQQTIHSIVIKFLKPSTQITRRKQPLLIVTAAVYAAV